MSTVMDAGVLPMHSTSAVPQTLQTLKAVWCDYPASLHAAPWLCEAVAMRCVTNISKPCFGELLSSLVCALVRQWLGASSTGVLKALKIP